MNGREAVWCNIYTKEAGFLFGSIYIKPGDIVKTKVFIKLLEKILQTGYHASLRGRVNK